jgi:hypothetical protein
MELNDAGPAPAVPAGRISDRELWARAVDGDREAFGRIFDRHARTVYNHQLWRTADWSEAEDLTSTVFLHAWRRTPGTGCGGRRLGADLVGGRTVPAPFSSKNPVHVGEVAR